MFDAIAVTDTTVVGATLALVVFGGLRFVDDIVDVLVSLDGPPSEGVVDESETPNS